MRILALVTEYLEVGNQAGQIHRQACRPAIPAGRSYRLGPFPPTMNPEASRPPRVMLQKSKRTMHLQASLPLKAGTHDLLTIIDV